MSDDNDRWDVYLCHLDDHPASVLVNMAFDGAPALDRGDTLYSVDIDMHAMDEHGMGTPEEARLLNAAEARFAELAAAHGLVQVGRIRTWGTWKMRFYGPPDLADTLELIGEDIGAGERDVDCDAKPDPTWSYYTDFLLPDAQQRRWLADSSVVHQLREAGDDATKPRVVEHFVIFPTAAARDAFAADATAAGFTARVDDSLGVQVDRVDPVTLAHIHDVVMSLVALADKHGGSYDGWGTTVER